MNTLNEDKCRDLWIKFSQDTREKLVTLLRKGQKQNAVSHLAYVGLDVDKAIDFLEHRWIWKYIVGKPPKDVVNKWTDAECVELWNKLDTNEREDIITLLREGKKLSAIKRLRQALWLTLKEAKGFIDYNWVWKIVLKVNQTSAVPKDEFRKEVLRIATDMLTVVNDSEMLAKDKYYILSKINIPNLFYFCMGE